jgi:hypothetical protein
MHLQAWYLGKQWLDFDDNFWHRGYCCREENMQEQPDGSFDYSILIFMKGCLVVYSKHRSFTETKVISKQNTNLAILAFQLSGNVHVCEKNFDPYRWFEQEVHTAFFTNKRELVFNVPLYLESFRIYLSPEKFLELLARFYGRFSDGAERVTRSEYFNLWEEPLPITPKMKLVIKEIISHKVSDQLLSTVFFETKITELFGYQLEQKTLMKAEKSSDFSDKS